MWMRCALAGVLLLAMAVAFAQEPPPPRSAPKISQSVTAGSGDGDIVTLKSGKKFRGVQVLSANERSVELLVMRGVSPLVLPAGQVTDIQYDDYEPRPSDALEAPGEKEPEPEVVRGTRLSPELDRKLIAPLEASLLETGEHDLVPTLEAIAKRVGVDLILADEVRKMPPDKRLWQPEFRPGTSFLAVLSDLPKTIPAIKVVYQYDKILITTRTAYAASKGE